MRSYSGSRLRCLRDTATVSGLGGVEALGTVLRPQQAKWRSLADVRVHYRSADLVGRLLIFNLLHNRYRLIVRENFRGQALFVKAVLTHAEYDRKEWMRWNN